MSLKRLKKKMKPLTKALLRDLTDDDAARLTEIKIKRISKFDTDKANDKLVELEGELETVIKNLKSLTKYTIAYFKKLKRLW